jgi:hypothetical protein
MGHILTMKEIDLLEFLGFKPEYPDELDRDYCQYVKKIHNHVILKGLHIIVSEEISVWCCEEKGGISGGEFLIATYPFSLPRLLFIVGYLTCNL